MNRAKIYLDSAATSLRRPPEVAKAVAASIKKHAGYGRGGYGNALAAEERVYACRTAAAELFGLKKAENTVFCQNATHALNIAILGLLPEKGRILISGYEHNAVLRPVAASGCGYEVAKSGLFDADGMLLAFERALCGDIGLVVCTMASNVFGNVLPVARIGEMCAEKEIPFIVDASQAAGVLDVDAGKLNADVICMPGHKGLMGPAGTGLMLLSGDRLPSPLMFGGTGTDSESSTMPGFPPERYEAGTQNLPGICGLEAGIRYVLSNREEIKRYEAKLVSLIEDGLKDMPHIIVYSPDKPCERAGLISFCVEGEDSEVFAQRMADRGVALRAGLHCAPLAHRSAGTFETGTVRASVSPFSGRGEIEEFLTIMEEEVRRG